MRTQSPHSWSNKRGAKIQNTHTKPFIFAEVAEIRTHALLFDRGRRDRSECRWADQRRLNYLFGKLGVPIICGGLVATGWSRARTLGRVCSYRSATSITRSRSAVSCTSCRRAPRPVAPSAHTTCCEYQPLLARSDTQFRLRAYKCYLSSDKFDFMAKRNWKLAWVLFTLY